MNKQDSQALNFEECVREVAKRHDADVIVYLGPIDEAGVRGVMEGFPNNGQRAAVFLLIVTNGGNPHVAYRLGRALQRRYDKIIACVPGRCASGGTLLILAAHTVTMSESGVLGPIDIQVPKSDELFEWTSGLTVGATIGALSSEAQAMFRDILFGLKTGSSGQITLKTAIDTAASLTTGMFGPLFAQIDPLRLGEDGRSTRIMEEYGDRLARKGENARPGTVSRLVAGYPSHNFEIDREEAREELFHCVEEPNDAEQAMIESLGELAYTPAREPFVKVYPTREGGHDKDAQSNDATNDTRASGGGTAKASQAAPNAPREHEAQVQSSSGTKTK